MTSVLKAYAPSRHGQLHYRIAQGPTGAAAPPLLCLHQTPAHSGSWTPMLEALSAHRTVVAPDTPGYGMSDPPPGPIEIADFAAIMAQFMTDLADQGPVPAGPFDVMGFHTGSITATELARAFPERVRRLVLFGLAAYPADIRAAKLENLRNVFPEPGDDLAHVEKLWGLISQLSDPRVSAEERHIGMAESLRLGVRLPWGFMAVYRYDFLGAMLQVKQPVLVMNPEDDLWVVTMATSHLFPNGTRLDMPGVAHGVLKLEKDRVVQAIETFLDAA
jgi:pimeloyl-ACP methyl ester carboxylesterase